MQIELNFDELSDLLEVVYLEIGRCKNKVPDLDISNLYALRTKLSNALAVHAMQSLSLTPEQSLDDGAGESQTAQSTPTDNPLSNGVPVSYDLPPAYLGETC